MSRFAIAALQLESGVGDNVDSMLEEIDAVKRRFPWVRMVVLGELNAFGPRTDFAEPLPGPTERRFCEAARRNGVWLVPGSLYERAGAHTFNTAPVIDPSGAVVARYRKQFPFLPYERGVAAGSEFCTFDVPEVGRFGLCICYDMWFPEAVRPLACLGAEVILHPSLTNTIDREVEIAIARANAATNQCYFVSVNAGGRLALGQSCVIGPGGEVVYQAGRGREIIAVELDLDYVRSVRARGWHGLGQTLKSFRDTALPFEAVLGDRAHSEPLRRLGPLEMPRTDAAGVAQAGPAPPPELALRGSRTVR